MKKTMTSLRKDALNAPKYVLKISGLKLYLSKQQPLIGCDLTDNIKDAMHYSIGFDNPEMKLSIWNTIIAKQTNNVNVKFEIVKL